MKNFTILVVIGFVFTSLNLFPKNSALPQKQLYGKVLDGQTHQALPGANILVEGTHIGTTADANGEFKLTVPIGRLTLQVSFIGYQTTSKPLLINSGSEPYVEIPLQIKPQQLKTAEVKAEFDKSETVNAAVYTSGRSFSVEEAYRYAGTLGDPARMVRNYSGVVPERDDRNDIIIRGNSPVGILWRLDGIEIPNPNHYGGIGLTGNTTTLLNVNLLDNSDFLTGAFPAQYGNATAGVFDLRLRRPNPKNFQFWFQSGWNGLELGTEGPIGTGDNPASFMAVYRYSFLDALSKLGADLGINPQFQDFTTKVQLPVSDKLDLTAIAILSTSFIELDERDQEEDYTPVTPYGTDLTTGSDLNLVGLNANYKVNDKSYFKSGVSVLANKVTTQIDTFSFEEDAVNQVFMEQSQETKYSFFGDYNLRTGRKNMLRVGARWDSYDFSYHDEGYRSDSTYGNYTNTDGWMHLLRVYAEDEYFITPRFRGRLGLHAQFLFLNGSMALEPRASVQYNLNEKQKISLAYGLHNQLQPRTVYFVETQTPNGPVLTNEDLDFTRAQHLVVGYDLSFTKNFRFKAEAYYQSLSQIPIEADPNSSFSLANVGADFYIPTQDSLVNQGLGRNYGVELTLEKFLAGGYYFMLNSSFYQSEYQAADAVWRNTAFNLNYMWNALGGYEHWFSPKFALGTDIRVTQAGGKPYTPVNEQASVAQNEVVFYEDRAFSERYNDYFRLDLRVYYRINYKKLYLEFAVDFQNLTDRENVYRREFVPVAGAYNTFYQTAFFVMPTFKAVF